MVGSIRKRNKSYRLTVDIGRHEDGRRHQFTKTFRTRREAAAALADMLKQAQAGAFVKPGRLTTADYLRRWLSEYAESHVRFLTLRRYRTIIERHLIPVIGTVPLTSLQPRHVQQVHGVALAAGLSARSVVQHHRILSEALKHAERWGEVSRNVARLVTPPRPAYREASFLDAGDAVRIMEAAKSTKYYVPIALALATGLRRGELLGLQWPDVDLRKGILQVTRALHAVSGVGLVLQDVKSFSSRRRVLLSPNATLLLRAHREQAEAMQSETGTASDGRAFVFGHPSGQPLSPNTLSHAFIRIARSVGVEGVHFHSLRHTHASLLLAQGVGLKDIQARLGHSSIAITADTYAHLTEQQQRDVATRFDQALEVSAAKRDQDRTLDSPVTNS